MCAEPARGGRGPVERPLITAVKQRRGGEKKKEKRLCLGGSAQFQKVLQDKREILCNNNMRGMLDPKQRRIIQTHLRLLLCLFN